MSVPRIQEAPLRLDALITETERPDCGAVTIFSGNVRDNHEGKAVSYLVYTAHVPTAERMIRDIEDEVVAAQGGVCRIAHRIGRLEIGEPSVLVVARAPHRAEAFAGARLGIDEVKKRVPIWKEEFYADGTRAFVKGTSLV